MGMYRHGFEVISMIDNTVLARCDDDTTPDLTPGGQLRTAMRVARKFRGRDHLVRVIGYFGGIGTEQIDDPSDDYAALVSCRYSTMEASSAAWDATPSRCMHGIDLHTAACATCESTFRHAMAQY